MSDKDKCDLAGKIYQGRHPGIQGYDGRLIKVLGWCMLSDGLGGERRVLVKDSNGKVWATEVGRVRETIKQQEAATAQRIMVSVMTLFEDGACEDRCPDGGADDCTADWCPAMEAVKTAWLRTLDIAKEKIMAGVPAMGAAALSLQE